MAGKSEPQFGHNYFHAFYFQPATDLNSKSFPSTPKLNDFHEVMLILATVKHIKSTNMQNLCAKLILGKQQYGRIDKVIIYVGFMRKLNFTLKTLAESRRKNYCCVVSASP